ncbi:efflux RND transporter periplasmic adaptor subunit [Desulfopila aestuarii]|uniref:RND family efflux transporter, MFP subunit n=1 Tax=Desulfopila aestuarii DSM 18488 TaxID=1121416 RepID=A0A1M7YAY7_9BACT|nr:efflux RND transporter periplasmic adaptor subunit [Desulfopila aestuarii]SHO49772.1 RND family efflux transporter, MFP subunit [Desulfopila aestuarii DSM 18488]
MSSPTTPPKSLRARTVYFIWSNMPRFALLMMVALIVVLFFAIKKEGESIAASKAAEISSEKPPVNAVTLLLTPREIQDRINLPGSIEPWTDLQLLAKIKGTVTELLVSEGDRVNEGDIIARIEEADYRIALERARAAYNQAKADLERDKSIYSKGMIPTADIENRRTNLAKAKADLEDAELQYSRCNIVAPMSGIIKTMDAKIGLLLSVGDPIARILEIDRLKGVIGIPESDVNAVRPLTSVEMSIQALGDEKIIGKNQFISPAPDSVARLYEMELAIDNSDGRILPGMFVRADIVKKTVANAVVVPFYSVISRKNEHFVFVEKNGVVEKRNVKMGIMDGWMVQITTGLAAGENLVVEGHRDVENGQQVNVIKALTNPGELTL